VYSNQGLKNGTERNETVLTVLFQKRNETKRKIYKKMRNEKKRNEIQRNGTDTKKNIVLCFLTYVTSLLAL
jgi:hypothetical protein